MLMYKSARGKTAAIYNMYKNVKSGSGDNHGHITISGSIIPYRFS